MKKLMTSMLAAGLVFSLGCGEPAKDKGKAPDKGKTENKAPEKKDEGKAPEKKDESKAPEAKTGEKEAKKP